MSKRRPRASQEAGWEFLGSELRSRRLAAGLTQDELGERAFVSRSYIAHFEAGGRKPSLEMAAQIDVALETDGFFERLCRKLLEESPYAAYFQKAAELEKLATKISDFESMTVPGLLQTAAYARAVTIASNPFAEDEFIEEKVTARIERARILSGPTRLDYRSILHEAVLRIPVGGAATMAEQLDHITRLVRDRRTQVQILPFAAGPTPIIGRMVKLMEFEDAPPTVYTEAVFSSNLLDEPTIVRRVQADYDLVRAAALSPEASLSLIESVAEDYRRCASTT